MAWLKSKPQLWALKSLLHLACLLPAAWIFGQGIQDQLGADPVKALIHFYGIGAIHCLFATLLISPLSRVSKTPLLIQCRRLLGLYSFFYALLHLLCFMMFEWQWQISRIATEMIERPYMTVGLLAWLITAILALTSFKSLQQRLGKKWLQLHSLIYPLILLAVIHYYWSQKSPWNIAIFYGAFTLILLVGRRKKLWLWLELLPIKDKNKQPP